MHQRPPAGSALALLLIVAAILLLVAAIIFPALKLSHRNAPAMDPDTLCLRGYLFERYADGKPRQIFVEGHGVECEEHRQ